MHVKIKNIATVSSGVYLKEHPQGLVYYLQVNDFDKEKNVFCPAAPSVDLDSRLSRHLLQEGDILFAAKGTSNFCTVFGAGLGDAVASSSFLVIRITDKKAVDPEFLSWTFNREDTLSFLKANAVGSSIPSIGKSVIDEYEIAVPPVSTQHKIIEIARLQQQEQVIRREIANLRNKLIQQHLIKIIQ